MRIYITEATICDVPDYQTLFGKPTQNFDEAVAKCTERVQEEINDLGDEGNTPTLIQVSDTHWKVTDGSDDCLSPYFITMHEV